MADPFISEIRAFAFNWVPQGWLACDGSSYPINNTYAPLVAIIGSTYGGDSSTYFKVPDLRGRAPAGQGTSGTLPPYTPGQVNPTIGSTWGTASITLNLSQIPIHQHFAVGYAPFTNVTQTGTPGNTSYMSLLRQGTLGYDMWSTDVPTGTFPPQALAPAGGGQAHTNNQPYLPVNFCICLDGVFMPNPN